VKLSLRWLAVLLLTTISIPATLFAIDGNPDGPPPRGGIIVSVPGK
jgi:hypothetical protein